MTSSARAIVDGRDATISTVVPASASRRLPSTTRSVSGSSADVVSSSSNSSGRADQRPGQRDALPLPAAQADASLADDGVEPVAELAHEAVGAGEPQRRPHLVVGVAAAEDDVLADRAGEQERLLEHHRPRPRPRGDVARVGPDQPAGQLDERALAGAGRADDRHDAAGRHRQVDVGERRLGLAGERERRRRGAGRRRRRARRRPLPRGSGSIGSSSTSRTRSHPASEYGISDST